MRLDYNIVYKLKELTASEIDFFIGVAQYQDGQAQVRGIDYRQICKLAGICKSNAYKVKDALIEKGFLKDIGSLWNNWSFEVIGNQDAIDRNSRYLNLNFEILHSPEFISMKKNLKLICLKLIEQSSHGKKEIVLSFSKIQSLTGATMQSVKRYVAVLQNTYSGMVRIGENKFGEPHIFVTNKLDGHETKIENKKPLFERRKTIERTVQKAQEWLYYCKKEHIRYNEQELIDTAALYSQYSKKIPDSIDKNEFIRTKILDCISESGKIVAAKINDLIHKALECVNPFDNANIPKGYNLNYIPYGDCFDTEKIVAKLDELTAQLRKEYEEKGGSAELDILKITIKNLRELLTGVRKQYKHKGDTLTHLQLYEKLMEATTGWNRSPSADEFKQLMCEYIDDVMERLPAQDVKSDLDGYLRTWFIDFVHKKAVTVKTRHTNRKAERKQSKFANFKQRKWDFDEMERINRDYNEKQIQLNRKKHTED